MSSELMFPSSMRSRVPFPSSLQQPLFCHQGEKPRTALLPTPDENKSNLNNNYNNLNNNNNHNNNHMPSPPSKPRAVRSSPHQQNNRQPKYNTNHSPSPSQNQRKAIKQAPSSLPPTPPQPTRSPPLIPTTPSPALSSTRRSGLSKYQQQFDDDNVDFDEFDDESNDGEQPVKENHHHNKNNNNNKNSAKHSAENSAENSPRLSSCSNDSTEFEPLPSFVLRNIPFNANLLDVVKFLHDKGGVVPASTVFHFDNLGRFMGVAIVKFDRVQDATHTASAIGNEMLQGRHLRVALRFRRTTPSLPPRQLLHPHTQPLPQRSAALLCGEDGMGTPEVPRFVREGALPQRKRLEGHVTRGGGVASPLLSTRHSMPWQL